MLTIIPSRLPRECTLLSGKSSIPFPALQAARDWNHAQPKRLPRECGGPVDDKFHEVVNSYAGYVIDLCEGLFVHWIPAFARKSLGERRFIQLMLYTLNRASRTVVSECGDPGPVLADARNQLMTKLHEVVIYLLRGSRGFIINWIPAFARKTMEVGVFSKQIW